MAVVTMPARLGPIPPTAARMKKVGEGPSCIASGGVVMISTDHSAHENR
jgi:hypothetical protein